MREEDYEKQIDQRFKTINEIVVPNQWEEIVKNSKEGGIGVMEKKQISKVFGLSTQRLALVASFVLILGGLGLTFNMLQNDGTTSTASPPDETFENSNISEEESKRGLPFLVWV